MPRLFNQEGYPPIERLFRSLHTYLQTGRRHPHHPTESIRLSNIVRQEETEPIITPEPNPTPTSSTSASTSMTSQRHAAFADNVNMAEKNDTLQVEHQQYHQQDGSSLAPTGTRGTDSEKASAHSESGLVHRKESARATRKLLMKLGEWVTIPWIMVSLQCVCGND